MRDSENRQYDIAWLQYDRPQPMYDKTITQLYDRFYAEPVDFNVDLEGEFKRTFLDWLDGHSASDLKGYRNFARLDVSHGCTQYIDDIYQRCGSSNVMIFEGDYKYHWRLNNDIVYTTLASLVPGKELLISMPFPSIGDVHPEMQQILDRCEDLGIPVHIDGAWISCSRGISFDFDHPAISTFCISLSKGGIGSNRIGLRFARGEPPGAITIMNDYNMNPHALMKLGTKFMRELGPEYFWRRYTAAYHKVCDDFDLSPTKSIHLARTRDGAPVGIRPLLRYIGPGDQR